MREMGLGLLASLFFSITFILNRAMELDGGSWAWSASLRFLFMIPFLLLIVLLRRGVKQVFIEIAAKPLPWIIWSFTGFVLFYAPLTFAAAYGPGWLVAGSWQITIVAGVLISPFLSASSRKEKLKDKWPVRSLWISLFILSGIALIQAQSFTYISSQDMMFILIPVLAAAFAYPLGNRKMMDLCDGRLDTFQRILGMLLCTLPVWLIVAGIELVQSGPPSVNQTVQTFIVAVCSGVIATTLFFIATNAARKNKTALASVEATQSLQILFVVVGEWLLLSSPMPNTYAWTGIFIIVAGIIMHSFSSRRKGK
ncbi:putative multidrug resistance efflux transporter [Sinobaca qinghaiensis]|uniref:Putative multidrug resistance efflux transporter n=1 Tax=Sinobaca qinghaiensis TaxID=342944 RepID=A0A419V6C7_9BACL|nr:multidrug resistance efflux transporter family protein [Sinobaca qinghaiensis]RKD75520.1 putative multidrug resistance efflux transporter [Sinobaca qinghaiensis]